VDQLLGQQVGRKGLQTFWAGIIEGHYLVADLPLDGYARVVAWNRRFDEIGLGFVDAAIAALAETLGLSRIGTTDRRHFEPLAAALSFQLPP
jgi:predicted nucleic acid-binding protein